MSRRRLVEIVSKIAIGALVITSIMVFAAILFKMNLLASLFSFFIVIGVVFLLGMMLYAVGDTVIELVNEWLRCRKLQQKVERDEDEKVQS